MEIVLVMAATTILLMVLAFLSLTREDRELAKEDLSLTSGEQPERSHPGKPSRPLVR